MLESDDFFEKKEVDSYEKSNLDRRDYINFLTDIKTDLLDYSESESTEDGETESESNLLGFSEDISNDRISELRKYYECIESEDKDELYRLRDNISKNIIEDNQKRKVFKRWKIIGDL